MQQNPVWHFFIWDIMLAVFYRVLGIVNEYPNNQWIQLWFFLKKKKLEGIDAFISFTTL